MQFDAFISYSHSADAKLGASLQRGLHRLACPWYGLRALHVFRDQTSLSASPALWLSIEAALSASKSFILLASPAAANSQWVRREVSWWLEHRPLDRMLIAVTSGRIAWDATSKEFDRTQTDCIPSELLGRFREEPLWVDLRGAKSRDEMSLRHSGFRAAVLDLAAPLHGRPKESLDGEDVRQHRRARFTAIGGIIGLVVLTVFSIVAAVVALQQGQNARSRELAALSEARLAGDPDVALHLALEAFSTRATASSEAALRAALGNHYLRRELKGGHSKGIVSLAMDPDEKLLASADQDQAVNLWSVEDGRLIHRLPADGANAVSFSTDGTLIVTAGARQPRAWRVETGTLASTPPATRDEVVTAVFDSTRDLWIVVDEDDGLLSWSSGQVDRRWTRLKGSGDRLQLLDSGRQLMTVSRNTSAAAILDTRTWREIREFGGPGEWVQDASVAARAGKIAVASGARFERSGDHVLLADHRTGETLNVIHSASHDFQAIALDADGRWLATGGPSGTVQLWGVDAARLRRQYGGHREIVRSVAVLAERRLVVSGGDDGRILVWRQPDTDVRWRTPAGLRTKLYAIGGRAPSLAIADDANGVVLFDTSREETGARLSGYGGSVRCLAIGPQEEVLVGTSEGLWVARRGVSGHRIAEGKVSGCAFRGDTPVWSGEDGRIGMGDALLPKWRSEGEAALETLSGDLNPSGTIVIGRGQGLGKIAVGKVDDASARFLTHSTEGFRLAIASASGDAIYACSDYGPLRRFDSASGTLTLEIALGGRSCTAIAASPDNRFVAIADEHGNIDVFSAASASRIKTLNGPMRKLSELAFGPTSNEITAVDDEERLHIFSCDACLDVTELVVLARSRLTRVLKDEERVLLGGVPVSWLPALRGLFR